MNGTAVRTDAVDEVFLCSTFDGQGEARLSRVPAREPGSRNGRLRRVIAVNLASFLSAAAALTGSNR